jgi:hypothetical protein
MANRTARIYTAMTHFCSCSTAIALAVQHEPPSLVGLALATSPLTAVAARVIKS